MYTLRFPFELIEGQAISDIPVELDWGPYRARLEARNHGYVLTVTDLPDRETAESYERKVRFALYWLLLDYTIAAKSVRPLGGVTYAYDDAGAALGGVIDGNCPAVFPTDEAIQTLSAGPARITTSRSGKDIGGKLHEGIQLFQEGKRSGAGEDQSRQRLETALDLYRGHLAEESLRAKFLTLIMAIEALCEPAKRPPEIQNLLKRFRSTAAEVREAGTHDPETDAALQSLHQELDFRSSDSIRNQVRRVVRNALVDADDVDAAVKEMMDLYSVRSTLTHEGTIKREVLGDAYTRARPLVQRVLRARIMAETGDQ